MIQRVLAISKLMYGNIIINGEREVLDQNQCALPAAIASKCQWVSLDMCIIRVEWRYCLYRAALLWGIGVCKCDCDQCDVLSNVFCYFCVKRLHGECLKRCTICLDLSRQLTTSACMQSLAARVGIITGQTLGSMCLHRYGTGINKYLIWAFQQVGTFGDDIQACVGATVALQIMTNIPFWSCVLIVLALSILLTIAYYWSPTQLELLIGIGLAGMLALTIANAGEGHAYFPDILKGWVAPLIPEGQVKNVLR